MKSFTILFLFVGCWLTIVVAASEQESKFQEIIQLLNSNNQQQQNIDNQQEHQLKAEAQTYSASVADPGSSYSQGYSRDRSRYSSSQPVSNNHNNAPLDEEEKRKLEEEEEEKKPDRLALLLAESKFSCQDLKNGYYADESVGCQVFHYCIEGVKHSWQCPENTVFHQIHLNCVPNTQDICQQSSKYHIVNEYLHKELDERGPNNTVLYHQRFYPDGFDYSGGDPVAQIFQAQAQAALQKAQQARRQPQPQPIEEDEEEEPIPRPRTRSRQPYLSTPPQNQPSLRASPQPIQNQNRQQYRQQIGRPLVSYQPQQQPPPPAPQPKPTPRPIQYTTQPDTFAPPTYTESPQEDFSPNDYSRTSDSPSSSLQSGFQPANPIPPSTFNLPSTTSFSSPSSSSSFQPSGSSSSNFSPSGGSSGGFTSTGSSSGYTSSGSSTSYTPSSSSSFSPSSSSQNSGGFRTSSRSNYPTHRSLGIPIASFRVAPASSFAPSSSSSGSSPQAQASSIQEVNVSPLISFTSLSNNQDENQQLLSQLFY